MAKSIIVNHQAHVTTGIDLGRVELGLIKAKALEVSVHLWRVQAPDYLTENMRNVRLFLIDFEKGSAEQLGPERWSDMCRASASIKEYVQFNKSDDIKVWMNDVHEFLIKNMPQVPVQARGEVNAIK